MNLLVPDAADQSMEQSPNFVDFRFFDEGSIRTVCIRLLNLGQRIDAGVIHAAGFGHVRTVLAKKKPRTRRGFSK
jgi:hypothetical protein